MSISKLVHGATSADAEATASLDLRTADPLASATHLQWLMRDFSSYNDNYYYGGDGFDDFDGQFGDDYIEGAGGADELRGSSGDDRIYGDRAYGGNPSIDGADSLYGGGGDDQLYGGAKGDRLDGGAGNDTIYADGGADRIFGGTGVDTMSANYKASSGALSFIVPSEGYRVSFAVPGGITALGIERWDIRGTDFADTMQGWIQDDTLMGGLGGDRLRGLAGDDHLYGAYGADSILGGSGDDSIYGDDTGYYDYDESNLPEAVSGADTIDAGIGDDDVRGGGGGDSILGGGGNDDLDGDDGGDRIDGGVGNDDIEGDAGADSLVGGLGNDWLYSNGDFNHDGGTERDSISGGGGADFVSIGVGDWARGGNDAGTLDTIRMTFETSSKGISYDIGAQGQFIVTLANGANIQGFEVLDFHGGGRSDGVTGGSHADTIDGGYGADTLHGGGGNDILDGETGNDRVYGDGGNDSFSDSDANLFGTDILDWNDSYYGGRGEDRFSDGYGADYLNGGDGNDSFSLGPFLRNEYLEADTVDGGAGWDLVDYGDADFGVVINLGDQSRNDGAAYNDRLYNVEGVKGSSDDDVLIGNGSANWLYGGGRDDVLKGGGGGDWLEGGTGADEITGGAGKDSFVLEFDRRFLETHWPHDNLVDFKRGEDKLAIDDSDFGITAQTFALVNSATSNVTSRQGPTFIFEKDSDRLWFDVDGKGVDQDGDGQVDVNEDAVLIATFLNASAISGLSESDFLIF